MPKYQHMPVSLAGWLFAGVATAAFAYLAFAEWTAVVVLLAVLVCGFLFASKTAKREEAQLRALAASREGESICEFAREFDLRAVDKWVVRAVYEQLQKQLAHAHPAFPIRADDRLKQDLHLDDDDLDVDVAVQVEQRTGRSLDNASANPYFDKVQTVRDLIMFFQVQGGRGAA